jgi:high affinity Mn2+ porin
MLAHCRALPLLVIPLVFAGAPAAAQQPVTDEPSWAWYGQATNVTQHHKAFSAPYSGENSLDPHGRTEETTDLTAYLGKRVWRGAELWLNPEIDQGFGLSNTVGMAGFPSGEAYKVGANRPYLRLPRAFIRQVIELGGAQENVEGAPNQLQGRRAADRLELTVGKFSVTDLFDTNRYAHDPRADFLNWSVIDAGTFDYAADAWGFTYGAAAEWTQSDWTARAGLFQLSKVPNGKVTRVDFGQQMWVAEFERRVAWHGHPGKVKLLGFLNHGRMGSYLDAVELARQTGGEPDTAAVRRGGSRSGVSVNVEQELAGDLGVFVRAGINQGGKEAYEFTEINRTVSLGAALKGERWGRAGDTVGLAGVVNGLSSQAKAYFARGGIGILIGDGQQAYGPEKILETYYAMRLDPHLSLTVDLQHVVNPAYNHARGPVSIVGARAHLEF